MGSKFEERIYRILSREPVTPNEVAKKLEISHKTALRAHAFGLDEKRYGI